MACSFQGTAAIVYSAPAPVTRISIFDILIGKRLVVFSILERSSPGTLSIVASRCPLNSKLNNNGTPVNEVCPASNAACCND